MSLLHILQHHRADGEGAKRGLHFHDLTREERHSVRGRRRHWKRADPVQCTMSDIVITTVLSTAYKKQLLYCATWLQPLTAAVLAAELVDQP